MCTVDRMTRVFYRLPTLAHHPLQQCLLVLWTYYQQLLFLWILWILKGWSKFWHTLESHHLAFIVVIFLVKVLFMLVTVMFMNWWLITHKNTFGWICFMLSLWVWNCKQAGCLYHFLYLWQLVVNEKTQNLRRLEAQRNELNAKGKCCQLCVLYVWDLFSDYEHDNRRSSEIQVRACGCSAE